MDRDQTLDVSEVSVVRGQLCPGLHGLGGDPHVIARNDLDRLLVDLPGNFDQNLQALGTDKVYRWRSWQKESRPRWTSDE